MYQLQDVFGMKSKVLVIVPTFVGSSSLGRKTCNKINSSDTVKTSVAYASANTNPAKNQSKKMFTKYVFLYNSAVPFFIFYPGNVFFRGLVGLVL